MSTRDMILKLFVFMLWCHTLFRFSWLL